MTSSMYIITAIILDLAHMLRIAGIIRELSFVNYGVINILSIKSYLYLSLCVLGGDNYQGLGP